MKYHEEKMVLDCIRTDDLHRLHHELRSCLGSVRYLQRSDGDSELDRFVPSIWNCGKIGKRLFS